MRSLRYTLTLGAIITGGSTAFWAANSTWASTAAAESVESVSTMQNLPVASIRRQWQDPARGRPLPVKIYFPADGDPPFPVILFSHGLGRSCEDYAYLGKAWASNGFMAIFIQHPGSDESVWRGTLRPHKRLKQAYDNKSNLHQRSLDLRFALNRLTWLQEHGEDWAKKADLSRIGAAGNDWGAEAVLALAGKMLPNGISPADPRIKAVLALSPTVDPSSLPVQAVYADIQIPSFYITGTNDNGRIGDTKAADRRIPFDNNNNPGQYLLTLYGGDHMVYAGHLRGRREIARDAHYQRLIREASLIFWQAHLTNHPLAAAKLHNGQLSSVINGQARLETKPVTEQQRLAPLVKKTNN